MNFGGLPNRQTCQLAGPPVYEPIAISRKVGIFLAVDQLPIIRRTRRLEAKGRRKVQF